MNILTVLTVIVVVRFSFGQTNRTDSGRCPKEWVPLRSHCYKIVKIHLTWDDARRGCERIGAILAEATTPDENQRITLSFTFDSNGTWNGIKRGKDGKYHFQSNNARVNYNARSGFDFTSKEGKDCMAMSTWGWRHYKCSDKKEFICQTNERPPTTTYVTISTSDSTTTSTNTTTTNNNNYINMKKNNNKTTSQRNTGTAAPNAPSISNDETQVLTSTVVIPLVKCPRSRGHRPYLWIWSVVVSQVFIICFMYF